MRTDPMPELPLFGNALTYPSTPGFKGERGGPSQEAAERIAGRASVIRRQVLDLIRTVPDLSADEISARLGLDRLSVRPRVSELHRSGLIVHAPVRAQNTSGMSAWCWRLAPSLPNEGASHG